MGVRWTPLRSRSTERADRRDRRKARGNPPLVIAKPCKRLWQSVFPFRVLRILSRFTLRMTHRLDIVSAVMCAAIRSFIVLRIFSSGALGIKKRGGYIAVSQSVDKPQVLFLRRVRRIYGFSLTRAAKKHLISDKPLIQRFFKGTGVVLAGIECSPKISDFRANGIPVGERVDFFDTLRGGYIAVSFFIHQDCKYRLGFRVSPLYNRVRC